MWNAQLWGKESAMRNGSAFFFEKPMKLTRDGEVVSASATRPFVGTTDLNRGAVLA